MGLNSAEIGSFFSKLLQKGDPAAAMAAGKGPVTADWAATHGYKQFRTPDMPTIKGVAEVATPSISLYALYAQRKQEKERIENVKKTAKQKVVKAEERVKRSRILRRPSEERGIL
jgi:hypothetical protein